MNMHMCSHMCAQRRAQGHTYTTTHEYMHTVFAYSHTSIHTYRPKCSFTCAHPQVRPCAYLYIHAHTCSSLKAIILVLLILLPFLLYQLLLFFILFFFLLLLFVLLFLFLDAQMSLCSPCLCCLARTAPPEPKRGVALLPTLQG